MKKNECFSVIWAEVTRSKMVDICRQDFAIWDEAWEFTKNIIRSGGILSIEVVDKEDVTLFERNF
jgi:hypothetical protein